MSYLEIDNIDNKQILYSIYNAFENTKSLTQKDILKKCIISSLSTNNYLNKDKLIVQCIDLINILNNQLCIFVQDEHIKFNSNKYSINEEHQDFQNFKINNLKFLTVTAHSIEYITKLNTMIDDITFGFSISSSDSNEEMNSETNEEIKIEKYYIYHSMTNHRDWYLIPLDLSTCTCKSFQYCMKDIKTCKHLEDLIQPNINLNVLQIVTKIGYDFTECTCNNFKLSAIKYCEHLDYFHHNR